MSFSTLKTVGYIIHFMSKHISWKYKYGLINGNQY